jgi:transposase-like protein
VSGLFTAHQVCDTRRICPLSISRSKHHRLPAEIISQGVWLCFRFCLGYRDVGALHFARGVTVTCEAIRKWCRTFGQGYAPQLPGSAATLFRLVRAAYAM